MAEEREVIIFIAVEEGETTQKLYATLSGLGPRSIAGELLKQLRYAVLRFAALETGSSVTLDMLVAAEAD